MYFLREFRRMKFSLCQKLSFDICKHVAILREKFIFGEVGTVKFKFKLETFVYLESCNEYSALILKHKTNE